MPGTNWELERCHRGGKSLSIESLECLSLSRRVCVRQRLPTGKHNMNTYRCCACPRRRNGVASDALLPHHKQHFSKKTSPCQHKGLASTQHVPPQPGKHTHTPQTHHTAAPPKLLSRGIATNTAMDYSPNTPPLACHCTGSLLCLLATGAAAASECLQLSLLPSSALPAQSACRLPLRSGGSRSTSPCAAATTSINNTRTAHGVV